MDQAKSGDKVKVHYNGTLEDGSIFDSSYQKDPIEFTIGEKKLIPGFEDAVVGMNIGEKKAVLIPAPEAYGLHQKELVAVVKKAQLPSNIELKTGIVLQVTSESGVPINFAVAEIAEETVTLDANHPLAGKDLNFEINLLKILS